MLFLLKFICCIGGTVILAGGVTAFETWLEKKPLIEEKDQPFYLQRR